MAERIPPGFSIPLGFHDGPEVKSIPRRTRAAAIGVWALCGNYSAAKLTDGYIDAEALKQFGCTPAIREALQSTLNANGDPSPLWVDARDGGVQFTNWPKWQRTRAEVTAFRNSEAERKRRARNARASRNANADSGNDPHGNCETITQSGENVSTSTDARMSVRTSTGRPQDVRWESGESETETELLSTYVGSEHAPNVGADERGLTQPVEPSASRLVATLIPDTIPAAVRTGLRIQTSQLIRADRIAPDIAAEALRRWLNKPGAGVGLLPAIAADVIRERASPAINHRNGNKVRGYAELAAEVRAQEQNPPRKELR